MAPGRVRAMASSPLVVRSRLTGQGVALSRHAEDVREQLCMLLYGVRSLDEASALVPARNRRGGRWWWLCRGGHRPLLRQRLFDEGDALIFQNLPDLRRREYVVELGARDGKARSDVVLMAEHARAHGVAVCVLNEVSEAK